MAIVKKEFKKNKYIELPSEVQNYLKQTVFFNISDEIMNNVKEYYDKEQLETVKNVVTKNFLSDYILKNSYCFSERVDTVIKNCYRSSLINLFLSIPNSEWKFLLKK